MKIVLSLLGLSLAGCVPLIQYQSLEKRLSGAMAERNEMTKDLAVCGERNRQLVDALKAKPLARPAVEKIDRDELEEMKKKAYEETEHKYQLRMNKWKIKK